MSQQGDSRKRQEDDWWRQLYEEEAGSGTSSAAPDSIDEHFDTALTAMSRGPAPSPVADTLRLRRPTPPPAPPSWSRPTTPGAGRDVGASRVDGGDAAGERAPGPAGEGAREREERAAQWPPVGRGGGGPSRAHGGTGGTRAGAVDADEREPEDLRPGTEERAAEWPPVGRGGGPTGQGRDVAGEAAAGDAEEPAGERPAEEADRAVAAEGAPGRMAEAPPWDAWAARPMFPAPADPEVDAEGEDEAQGSATWPPWGFRPAAAPEEPADEVPTVAGGWGDAPSAAEPWAAPPAPPAGWPGAGVPDQPQQPPAARPDVTLRPAEPWTSASADGRHGPPPVVPRPVEEDAGHAPPPAADWPPVGPKAEPPATDEPAEQPPAAPEARAFPPGRPVPVDGEPTAPGSGPDLTGPGPGPTRPDPAAPTPPPERRQPAPAPGGFPYEVLFGTSVPAPAPPDVPEASDVADAQAPQAAAPGSATEEAPPPAPWFEPRAGTPRDPRSGDAPGGDTAFGEGGVRWAPELPPGWVAAEGDGEPAAAVVGGGPPTYAAEPTAWPEADPDRLDGLVPDTVLDGARYGSLVLRTASVRGDSARYRGQPRRDAVLTARFGSGDDALLLVAAASGARAADDAHRAAQDAVRWIAGAVGRSRERLSGDLRAARRGSLKSGLHRLTDRCYGRLRARGEDLGLEEGEYTASLRCMLLPADPECRIRLFFGVGGGGLFRIRAGGWQDLDIAPEDPAAPFRFRATVAQPGDALLMCSAGLAEPLRGEPALAARLAERWDGGQIPGLASYLADVQTRVKGYADDRTAVTVWDT